jgi:hypothetical protein
MTVEELKALNLPIKANEKTALYVGAAIDWLIDNTTLEINKDNLPMSIAALPNGARLFICRYYDVMSTDGNVTSESIGGMSQSFGTSSKTAQLYMLACELLGTALKGQVRSVPNVSKWV